MVMNFYSGVDGNVVAVGDINQEIRSQQLAADDAMRDGEIFSIGDTIWQVTKRRLADLDHEGKEEKTQIITLESLSTLLFPRLKKLVLLMTSNVVTVSGPMRDGNEEG